MMIYQFSLIFSIGHVNAELYSLAAGTWNSDSFDSGSGHDQLEKWMHNYVNALCINAWQVIFFILFKGIFG